MKNWVLGVLGGVLTASIMWVLSNRYFPEWFGRQKEPEVKSQQLDVLCEANPATVSPGGTSEVTVKVSLDGRPIEGANVSLEIGGGRFQGGSTRADGPTYSGGIFRAIWTAPSQGGLSYNAPATVSIEGIRSASGELHGMARSDCLIIVK